VSGIAVLFVIHYPTRIFNFWGVLPIPMWLLVGFYLLSDLVAYRRLIDGGEDVTRIAYEAHLAGAAFAGFYYRTRWSLGWLLPSRWGWSFKLPRARPNLRVHDPLRDDQELNDRVDAILEKIHDSGEASLTAEERRTLEDASRRFQQRRR
jgi:hypothetical protein